MLETNIISRFQQRKLKKLCDTMYIGEKPYFCSACGQKFVPRPTDRYSDKLTGIPTNWPAGRLTNRLADRPTVRPTDRPTDRQVDRPADRTIDQSTMVWISLQNDFTDFLILQFKKLLKNKNHVDYAYVDTQQWKTIRS